ncbi:spore cortex-lytic enzyme [Hathewaya limosa]|uniref:Spore cortex-lytic enzyme n=2 Tax=Hathewaya limosa TaxID=1536 RepID=A0ABU0JXJ7_HATLI|nr:N-acetylmuramoyl-L-alanine amidase [Hathewaya limosa]
MENNNSRLNMSLFLIMIFIVMSVFGIVFMQNIHTKQTAAVPYSYGSTSDTVKEIQSKLKSWGYYSGEADGIYGYKTYEAVKYFQQKNGLSIDGVVGSRTLAALGINETSNTSGNYRVYNATNSEVTLLARAINGEARGEPYEGQVAVGAVILNRTRDPQFPSTIAGVIYQPGAFTATVDGQIDAQVEQSSINAARDALNGWDPSGGAIYYFNPEKTTNKWIWSRPLIKIIGKHRFCK